MKKRLVIALLATTFLIALTSVVQAVTAEWENICPNDNISYCANVGKVAYNKKAEPSLALDAKLGKIVGVAWRRKHEPITRDGKTLSLRDTFYYIIDDGSKETFLRHCDKVNVK